MNPPAARTTTRSEEIRARIADDIVHGRLSPGTPLEEIELARLFGVSRTPVREAIRQLEAEGFATARPRRGAVVASIGPERLQEMFAVMAELEATCARHAARNMTPPDRAGLEAAHAACGQALTSGDIGAYALANEAFHDAIYRGARNGFLLDLTMGVRRRCAPFRRAQFATLGRLRKSYEEHGRIVAAILRGEVDLAGREMLSHIEIVERKAEEIAYPARAANG